MGQCGAQQSEAHCEGEPDATTVSSHLHPPTAICGLHLGEEEAGKGGR